MRTVTYPIIAPVGEDALLVEYEPQIDLETNRQVRQLAFGLEQHPPPGVREVVAAYRSLMIYFDPDRLTLNELQDTIQRRVSRYKVNLPAGRLFRIPTVYGGAFGVDLDRVARETAMAPREIINLFSTQQYPVYCLGFLCGLAYLGGVPAALQLPRLTTPRPRLPAGSVGFAQAQAVVLTIEQPSGFHYIGRTFVRMYDPRTMPPTPVQPGDRIECPAVTEEQAKRWYNRPLGDCLVESTADH